MDYVLLSDLRDHIKECLDPCEYKVFTSLGRPQAECNSIGIWYEGSRRNRADNTDCATRVFDTEIMVTLTRCCVAADASIDFDFAQEEKDALCFHDDLSTLLACLSCSSETLLANYIISCGTLIESVRVDQEKMGGCYSADIRLSIVDDICCDGL